MTSFNNTKVTCHIHCFLVLFFFPLSFALVDVTVEVFSFVLFCLGFWRGETGGVGFCFFVATSSSDDDEDEELLLRLIKWQLSLR
jgi:hypothetical protein